MMHLVPLIAPCLYALGAIAASFGSSFRPRRTLLVIRLIGFAALATGLASLVIFLVTGSGTSASIGSGPLELAIRLDLLSAAMLLLVTFIGWIVLRYSATYLDGEARQGPFMAAISLTLAAVSLLVISGTLPLFVAAFTATSLSFHRLLVFYAARDAARRAARKKFLWSRIADGALVGAAVILGHGYGTVDIAEIMAQARAGMEPAGAGLAAALLALAALLKSAQFPTHGWLTEVMETPTPVSALLHAGVVNAGGFLLIRFADVMLLSPLTLAGLVMIGAFTAVFGSLVMLTESAIKTSLAWSTVSQMGFMILQCGLGLFPIALLHIITHSLYKAHAFLSSGTAVDAVLAARRPGPVAAPGLRAVSHAFLIALVIYGLAGLAFGFWEKPPQALALGVILIFGIAYLLAQGLADAAPRALTMRTCQQGFAAAFAYFALQWLTYHATVGAVPLPPPAGPLEWALILLAVSTFGLVALAQSLFPHWADHPAAAGLRVHLQNGLYVNAILDRLLGNFAQASSSSAKD